MKDFKKNTIAFGSVGRYKLGTGLICAGMTLISTAYFLLTKDMYQSADDESNEKMESFREVFEKNAKKNK